MHIIFDWKNKMLLPKRFYVRDYQHDLCRNRRLSRVRFVSIKIQLYESVQYQ